VKLSTKSQFALEALLDLALYGPEGPEPIGNIARRRGVSEHYLEQIFAALRKAGIVASVRGAQGGYKLAKAPADVTAGSVIRALEGPVSPVKCVHCSGGDGCPMMECCPTRWLWVRVAEEIGSVIDGVTLADLLEDCDGIAGQETL